MTPKIWVQPYQNSMVIIYSNLLILFVLVDRGGVQSNFVYVFANERPRGYPVTMLGHGRARNELDLPIISSIWALSLWLCVSQNAEQRPAQCL